MSKTVFTRVDYTLGTLIKFIALGEIGLPDIQRPFVWPNKKVRDLIDSMYKGYPVGFLVLWQNAITNSRRSIGTDSKQKSPRLLIVDGQQRLTSLYAVIQSIQVLRKNYKKENICIAFNPLEEKFEVTDAAIRRDKTFIPDISALWSVDTFITRLIRDYLNGLRSSREVSDEEEQLLEERILKLKNLLDFPLIALELFHDIDAEKVADIFVRINSKGTKLNQADFILTIMSVFWDEGRTELEQFCRDSRKPSIGAASPFNHFIEPLPAQLLRVAVSVAFRRAHLKYVYSILRGKDLETETFSDERRIQQFEILKHAQKKVLNLEYWHDFMRCIWLAGFRSSKMISSRNNLLFSYILYLIGRTDYNVPNNLLRQAISRWFFMSAVTGRFTRSPESAMESDLAGLRGVATSEEFLKYMNRICNRTLTNDFWSITLPNDLATSSPGSPSLFAYQASLVLLNAQALFSKIKVADLQDPSIHANRSSVERHHLFPKAYLKSINIEETRETNQIANYALVEWIDNDDISGEAPEDYLPRYRARSNSKELEQMYHLHALPANWECMEYGDFLERRRDLMAQIIADGYSKLNLEAPEGMEQDQIDISKILVTGESETQEFKATLRTNLHTMQKDPRMELAVLKTIAGFLNTHGGTLIVGVSDDGSPIGLDIDGFENEDKMGLHLVNIVKSRLGVQAITSVHMHFDEEEGCRVLVTRCDPTNVPIFVKDKETERFYIRTGSSTTQLTPSQTQDYIRQRFRK